MQDFILILLFGTGAAWLAKRLGQPSAVAQVLVGLIIGPPLLGWIETGAELQLVGQLGVVLLLGMAGMALGSGQLAQKGWTGLWVALLGMLFCLAGGYGFSAWWGSPHAEAVYVGTALTATSIGISVQVLHQLGLINHKVGRIVIAAAVIDDVLALYFLAIAHGLLRVEITASGLMGSMFLAAAILAFFVVSSRLIARKQGNKFFNARYPTSLIAVVFIIVAFGWLTETMGYSLVVGGFFAGLGLGDGLDQLNRGRLVKQLDRLVLFLVPFFFVIVGSKAQWEVLADPGMPVLVIGLLVVAILGKIAGGVFAAWRSESFRISLFTGVSMVPRGEVALIIAGLGYTQGHISHHVLVALILMTIGTALAGPLIMASLARSLK